METNLFSCLSFFSVLIMTASSSESPIIIEHPLDVIVSKGQPATLNCAAKPSSANITWYKDGMQVTTNRDQVNSHRIILDTGALFLLKVSSGKNGKDGDSGSYHCVARNEMGEAASREANLRIAMLRDEFRTRPKNVQALSGERAVLECSPPKGFPDPVVSWKKDDRELKIQDDNRLTLHPDGNLVIEPVSHADSGTYQCVAANMVGERVSPPARLSVYEKPKFEQEPSDMTVEVGSSVLFDCRVSGEPQPQISWKKRNEAMPVNRAYIAKDNRGLRIDRVQPSDEGEYVCFARNPAGSIESSARLRVQAPPTFSVKPSDVTRKLGEDASFECSATGQPSPALFWSKEGQQNLLFPGHVSVDGRVKVASNGRLTISKIHPLDEGSYVCAAMNSAGSSLAKGILMIHHVAKVSSHPPPIIEHGHMNQTIMVGSSAILPCQASGRTPPVISWLKDGVAMDISENKRYSQHSTGSLQIADLIKSDSGVYTCRAKNDDGQSTWPASLTVEEHSNPRAIFSRMPDPSAFPSAPSKPIVSNASESEVDVDWNAPERNGASPVTGYIIQYFSPQLGETWYNVGDYIAGTRHRVKDLPSSATFVFIVRAENEKGIGPPSIMSDPVMTIQRTVPTIDPLSLEFMRLDSVSARMTSEQMIRLEEVKTINSTAVRLFWKRKQKEDLIQGYYIKWRGPPLASVSQLINITDPSTESHVINGLLPFTNYEFFVIPYHQTVQGTPSNSMDALTAEAPPSLPPADVRIRMLNLTTLRISWRAPPNDGMNGILKGFQIVILGKGTKFNRNITTNERAASVTLFHLIPGMTYKIKVAARTNAGIGVAHGTDVVTMNQETLDRHAAASGENESFLFTLLQRSWFVVLLTVLVWIFLIALSVFLFLRYKRNKTSKQDRMGPFIKINDGSVHMNGMWPENGNAYNTAQRNTIQQRCPPSQPLYSLTPIQNDLYTPHCGDDYMAATMGRPPSEHHYHYAQLTGGPGNSMTTFYGGQYQDDPSPYATTTLVMSSQQPAWLNDRMLRGPIVPSNPVPNGPPARYVEQGTGRRSRASRASERQLASQQSDSPPHTDVSYVQSSDGTGGSSQGRGRRSPPKHTLMDFIPPPPPGNPPPDMCDYRRQIQEDAYDSVSDALLHGGGGHPLQVARTSVDCEYEGMGTRPTSRNRNIGGRSRGSRDDDSQRSSLMEGEGRESPDADAEGSENEEPKRRRLPCMGVSASALSQSSYDASSRSNPRFKSMQRNGGGHV